MENQTPDTPEVPSTVQDLLNIQKGHNECDHGENPNEFAEAVDCLMDDLLPDPMQTLRAARMLVKRLAIYHFDMVEDDEMEMCKFQKRLWKKDFRYLEKALELLTLVRED